jgi:hypothetical protein
MATFEDELIAALGGADDAWDIQAAVRRCFLYDFIGYPTRLWHGMGVLQAGGAEWLGTIDPNGRDHHAAPAVRDTRDGTSPRYTFSLPYVDAATFDALKADQALIRGRTLTVYHVIVKPGEGLRPGTALRFAYRMQMQGAEFAESVEGMPGAEVKVRRASVLCVSGESGRSHIPGGTYTDAAQQERARLAGVASDSFCAFVAANSRRTLHIEGT